MARRFLTAAMADKLLNYLLEHAPVGRIIETKDIKHILTATGLEFDELKAFLEDFQTMGLINSVNITQKIIILRISARFDALLETGGFSGDLAKLKAELQVLKNQLATLPTETSGNSLTSINNTLLIIERITAGLLNKY